MNITEMVEVLQAAERGEKIECGAGGTYYRYSGEGFNFQDYDYRIAPKKEMTLVEELRLYYNQHKAPIYKDAADRIEELEMSEPIVAFTTDELLEELKRRIG